MTVFVTVDVQPVTIEVRTTTYTDNVGNAQRPTPSNDIMAAGDSHQTPHAVHASSVRISPYDIAPLPHASHRSTNGTRKRRSEASTVLTSTPHKEYLNGLNAKKRKIPITTEKCARNRPKQCPPAKKLFQNESPVTRPVSRPTKNNVHKEQSKSNKRLPRVKNRPRSKTSYSTSGTDVSTVDNTPCVVCSRRYNEPPADSWTQCPTCLCWYHDSCGAEDTVVCFRCLP